MPAPESEHIFHLFSRLSVCLSSVCAPGAEGNVDGSLQLLKEVEEIKLKKKKAEEEYHALIPRHAVQQQKLKACEASQTNILTANPSKSMWYRCQRSSSNRCTLVSRRFGLGIVPLCDRFSNMFL